MSIVKRQHYIWRHYLRAWADKESIWAYLKETDKLIKSALMGVAQEKYFYRLVDFTDAEEAFLVKYILVLPILSTTYDAFLVEIQKAIFTFALSGET